MGRGRTGQPQRPAAGLKECKKLAISPLLEYFTPSLVISFSSVLTAREKTEFCPRHCGIYCIFNFLVLFRVFLSVLPLSLCVPSSHLSLSLSYSLSHLCVHIRLSRPVSVCRSRSKSPGRRDRRAHSSERRREERERYGTAAYRVGISPALPRRHSRSR